MKFVSVVLVAIAACTRTPAAPPPEVPDPDPEVPATSDDVAVCAHLALIGCTDAWPSPARCVSLMTQARTDRIVIPTACLAAANTVISARACGSADTLTFRCGER